MKIKKKRKHLIKHPFIKIYFFLEISVMVSYVLMLIGVLIFWVDRFIWGLVGFVVLGGGLWFFAKLIILCVDVIYYYLEEKGSKVYYAKELLKDSVESEE